MIKVKKMITLSGELSEKGERNVLCLDLPDSYTSVYMCTNASISQKKEKETRRKQL